MEKDAAERIAKDLARRWLAHESDAIRALFEREVAGVIQNAAKTPAASAQRAL